MNTLDELEKLLAAATPGPWSEQDGSIGRFVKGRYEWSSIADVETAPDRDAAEGEGRANALLICAAVNALPELLALREERNELQSVFDAQWGADMRAIQRWQIATGKEGTWPDRANLVVWLLERVEKLEAALKPFADEADKWANCIDRDRQEILIAHPMDVSVDSDGELDGLNDAAFTLGDLRRARAALKETGQ